MATRDIEAGEEILMNYIPPFGQSHARRQIAFAEQHIWSLGPSPFPPDMDELATSPSDPAYDTALVEAGNFEEHLEEASISLQAGTVSVEDAMLQLTGMLKQAEVIFAPRHLVLARVRQMLIDVTERAAAQGKATPEQVVLLIKVRSADPHECLER